MNSNPGLALVFIAPRSLVGPENFRPQLLCYSLINLTGFILNSSVGIYYFCLSFKKFAPSSQKNQLIQNQSLLSRPRSPALWAMWLFCYEFSWARKVISFLLQIGRRIYFSFCFTTFSRKAFYPKFFFSFISDWKTTSLRHDIITN